MSRGVRCTFVHADKKDGNSFPGIEALRTADLMFLSVRRRTPPEAQLKVIREYVDAGKPVVGWETDAYWLDIGRPDDYERAQADFEKIKDRFGGKA